MTPRRTSRITRCRSTLRRTCGATWSGAFLPLRKEIERHLGAGTVYLDIARGLPDAPKDPQPHYANLSNLSRDIGVFASTLLKPGQPYGQADLVASLIEEADFVESLGETLHQIAQRVRSEEFSAGGRELVNGIVDRVSDTMRFVLPSQPDQAAGCRLRSASPGLRNCVAMPETGRIGPDRKGISARDPGQRRTGLSADRAHGHDGARLIGKLSSSVTGIRSGHGPETGHRMISTGSDAIMVFPYPAGGAGQQRWLSSTSSGSLRI